MKTTLSSKIGIVSGIGPLAGSDALAKVFKNAAEIYGAVEDNEYPDLVLLNHGIQGVDNNGTLSDTFKTEIVDMVQQLEAQGATIIGIACNTAHTYLKNIRTRPGTTLVNLIDTVASVASTSKDRYLLLTSSASKRQKLYHGYLEKHQVVFNETSPTQQELLDAAIGLVMAYKLKEAGGLLEQVLASAKQAGFTAVIAGCTELPIAIAHCKDTGGLKIIDSNDELAKSLLGHYYQRN
jgi:aspartate racemase